MIIDEKLFSVEVANEISKKPYGLNWPVVYILRDTKEAYIGETNSITNRMKQHLKVDERKHLTTINIISHDKFNKSAILDVESKLIEYMSADSQYKIINSNSGMRDLDYFDKDKYELIFKDIWDKLRKKKIVKQTLEDLINSELFKYTPYKRLTEEQYSVVYSLVLDLLEMIQTNQTSITLVNGEAGTGKTVIAMYLMKLFADNKVLEFISSESEEMLNNFIDIQEKIKDFKFALVVPMTSLRGTLKKVMRNIEGLSSSMVIGPNDVIKDDYDLLIVDEAHRLYRRVAITGYGAYDNVNRKLNFKKDATQLDWIVNSSKYQILFYDKVQSVRPSDIRADDFEKLKLLDNYNRYEISSQLRVQGGNDYLKYIKQIFSDNPPNSKLNFNNYDFKMYDNIIDLKTKILEKDLEVGLSRLVAGYAWEWDTKNYTYNEAINNDIYDIKIDGEELIWNTTNSGWVISENSINEVGSIHTTQGYDLNYAGIIIGNDIYFDKKTNRIEVNKDNYFDKKGKQSVQSYEELRTYIINIYIVLMSRAIKGTFVYVCDDNLRKYLSRYI